MAADENKCVTGGLAKLSSCPVRPCELESTLARCSLRFVASVEEQYLCPACRGIVLNPHQTGCGHIFCAQCIRTFITNSGISKCPKDHTLIKREEVFQDNCCKRELFNLEVFCTNPGCAHTMTLGNLQDHLGVCPYEPVQCPNADCGSTLLRRSQQEHLSSRCMYRTECCSHCKRPVAHLHLKEHERSLCPEAEVECPYSCPQRIKRQQLKDHAEECPEVETDCVYRRYGCTVRDKRRQVKVHEYTEFNSHVLLVLESNTKLERQVEQLQMELLRRQGGLQERTLLVSSLDKEVSRCDQTLSALQRSMEAQREQISSLQQELQELRSQVGAELGREKLPALRSSLDSLHQQVAVAESLKEHLAVLEQTCQRHTRLLSIHVEQLQSTEERFLQLDSTSYDGKLIWKLRDYRRKKDAGAPLSSPSFYTSRSGYKLSARVYLGGDSSGCGTHLSLYVLLMRGDFDSLLPWPFRQNITLAVLDQSGARNHISSNFTPDRSSNSFQRPGTEANVATGFPRFVSHGDLEMPKNGVYVRDDTLFIKVKVDTAGLEEL